MTQKEKLHWSEEPISLWSVLLLIGYLAIVFAISYYYPQPKLETKSTCNETIITK